MNISFEHKIIWWAPERCATKATAHIFQQLGFESYYTTIDNKQIPDYHSHSIVIPEEYSDYKVICSIRNPYDRVLGLFKTMTNVGKSMVYTKDTHDNFMVNYENFLNEVFVFVKIKETNGFGEKLEKIFMKDFIAKYSFEDKIPDYFIRSENLLEDISKLEFVNDSGLWKSGYIQEYLTNNKYINLRPYKFDTVYTNKSAKLVFEYYKKHFFLCGYNPFSFTKDELNNEEKMRFIHDIF
jgi:hypothetical protein